MWDVYQVSLTQEDWNSKYDRSGPLSQEDLKTRGWGEVNYDSSVRYLMPIKNEKVSRL